MEAGDPVMQMDWAGSREGHTVGHLSVQWGRMVSSGEGWFPGVRIRKGLVGKGAFVMGIKALRIHQQVGTGG